jgi:hypothetical protein
MAQGGYDTADYIYNQASCAVSHYGTPTYWIRYFSPTPSTGTIDQSSSNAIEECQAAWNSGGHYLSPISSPGSTRLSSGSSAEGLADAQTLASALVNVYQWVAPLDLPSNGVLYTWLDCEQGTNLSGAYWYAWANYLNTYDWEGQQFRPLYASLYCDPCSGANCSTVGAEGQCFAIWSSEPETGYCGYDLTNLPPWHAASCSSCSVSVPTYLWQFAEKTACSLSYCNVDMNEGTIAANCFYLSAYP